MPHPLTAADARRFVLPWLALVFLISAILAWRMAAQVNLWTTFDWLISYDGGFVRRGLAGELLLAGVHLLGGEAQWWVLGAQLGFLGIFLVLLAMMVRRLPEPRAALPFLVSPGAIFFTVADAQGAFRKELILFAIMALLAWVFAVTSCARPRRLALLVVFAVLPLAILAHEAMIVYAPYLAFFLTITPMSVLWRSVFAVLLTASGAATVAVAFNSGTAEQAQAICAAITPLMPPVDAIEQCATGGPIAYLKRGPAEAIGRVLDIKGVLIGSVGPAMLLTAAAVAPLVPGALASADGRARRWLVLSPLVAMALSTPLFVVATDWGRFIYMHAVMLGLILMSAAAATPAPATNNLADRLCADRRIVAGALSAYALMWSLKHTEQLIGGGALMSFVQALI